MTANCGVILLGMQLNGSLPQAWSTYRKFFIFEGIRMSGAKIISSSGTYRLQIVTQFPSDPTKLQWRKSAQLGEK